MDRTLLGLVVALACALVFGQLLGLSVPVLFALGQLGGYVAIASTVGALVAGWWLIARASPASVLATAVYPVAMLLAAGPLGLYTLPVPLIALTPIAIWRALGRKHAAHRAASSRERSS